jgi:hypothetical protein
VIAGVVRWESTVHPTIQLSQSGYSGNGWCTWLFIQCVNRDIEELQKYLYFSPLISVRGGHLL